MIDHYTYRVIWSDEDGEYAGLCAEFPSLSWLAATSDAALAGIRELVAAVGADMTANGETLPDDQGNRIWSDSLAMGLILADGHD